MNKSDLVAAIADGSGLTKADAARALSATTGAISGALASGEKVSITGFGSFLVNQQGVILFKHIGAIDSKVWEQDFVPYIKKKVI